MRVLAQMAKATNATALQHDRHLGPGIEDQLESFTKGALGADGGNGPPDLDRCQIDCFVQVRGPGPTGEIAVGDQAEPFGAVGRQRGSGLGDRSGDVDDGTRREFQVGDGAERETPQASFGPEEGLDELVGRVGQQVVWCRMLFEHAAHVEDGHLVAQRDGLVDVMGHQHDRLADPLLQIEQFPLEPTADDGVHRSERLVHQQHRWVCSQGPGHADPLLLPSGEFRRIAVEHVRFQADQIGQFTHPVGGLGLVPPQQPGDGADVLGDGPVREQAHLLDDVPDPPSQFGDGLVTDVGAADGDRSVGRFDQPVHHPQRRGLAAARWPDEDGDRPFLDAQVERSDGGSNAAGKGLGHPAQVDGNSSHGRSPSVVNSAGRAGAADP